MHCFICGVTGFVGSHIAKVLLARGDKLIGLTRKPENTEKLRNKGITPVVGDIREPDEWVEKAVKADVIVQVSMLPLPFRPTKRYVERTVETEKNFLKTLLPRLDSSTRFVYTSGTGIYGHSELKCSENYPTNPLLRSRKDVVAERLILKAAKENHIKATILRPAPIYGTGGIFHKFWGSKLACRKRIIYPGDGSQKWSFISVWDCAQAYILAIDQPGNGDIYNVADNEPVTLKTFLFHLANLMGAPEPLGVPKGLFRGLAGPVYSQAMFSNFMASNKKIKEKLGFEPMYPTYREGTAALAETYKGNPTRVSI